MSNNKIRLDMGGIIKSSNETSNPAVLKEYHKRPSMQESTPDDLYCRYHIPPLKKIQTGRFWFCRECRGKPKLTSGKTIR